MVNVFPEIFLLGFLIVYVAFLVGLVWWVWHSRIRSRRRPTLLHRLNPRRPLK
jgi:hypothetical protein